MLPIYDSVAIYETIFAKFVKLFFLWNFLGLVSFKLFCWSLWIKQIIFIFLCYNFKNSLVFIAMLFYRVKIW